MKDKTNKSEKISNRLSKAVFESVVKTLIKDGSLSIEDFNDEEKFKKKLFDINKKTEWAIVIDHSDNLISTAKQFADKGDFDKAKLFYATFIEHEINKIIIDTCNKKKIDKKTANEIIRSTNMIAKLTWLPEILDIPKVNDNHRKVILKLSDDRNAFVHYKHNSLPDDIEINQKEKQATEIEDIKKTIIYFRKYSSRVLFKNGKTKVDKFLKNERNKKKKN